MAVQPNLQSKYKCRNKHCFLKGIVKLCLFYHKRGGIIMTNNGAFYVLLFYSIVSFCLICSVKSACFAFRPQPALPMEKVKT